MLSWHSNSLLMLVQTSLSGQKALSKTGSDYKMHPKGCEKGTSTMRRLSHLLFLLFLIIYSVIKYRAVPELAGNSTYMMSTGILVTLTAILPYGLAYIFTKNMRGTMQLVMAIVAALLLCVIGLAIYFFVFIPAGVPIGNVLPRAVVPGLVMGAILVIGVLTKRGRKSV